MNLEHFPPVRPGVRGLWHGGDYNPEQWPPEVWAEDARLMDEAHWNVATVGVFSWVSLEPEEGRYDFGWLERILECLHAHGRQVILATPSAAAPAWMSQRYPEIRRVGADGVRFRHGNRVNYCLTSPVYRSKCAAMASEMANRFGDHPALALWHVSNEYGGACHCSLCEEAFREWLRAKYGGCVDRLNGAYWTAFWGHTYTDWSQIEIPGGPYGESAVHGLTLDWRRFVSDQTIDLFEAEASVLRDKTPQIPITANFMGFYGGLDYWKFAKHLDIASWDSYPAFDGPLANQSTWVSVAMKHDLARSLKDRPFLLMECTPSASNWYPEMELKRPGMHQLEGMQAVAHGADSVQYFQWRQSRGGQEKFHGAVVPHEGTLRSRVSQDVARLGQTLQKLGEVAGSPTAAEVAIVYDWENAWAIEIACGPRQEPRGYGEEFRAFYAPYLNAGIPVDVMPADGDYGRYKLVIAPMLYMLKPGVAEAIEAFVQAGGTFVATYWTGIADESDLCFLGGFPGGAESPLRRTLGIWSEEIDVVYPSQSRGIRVPAGSMLGFEGDFRASTFCDMIHAESAEILAEYTDDFYAGHPALTVNRHGGGEAFYVASRNDAAFHTAFSQSLIDRLNLVGAPWKGLPPGVTARRRGDYVFLLNLTPDAKAVPSLPGWTNVESEEVESEIRLSPFGSACFRNL